MIKLFEQYNDYNQVKDWLDEMEVLNYTINDDLTVDVDGDVDMGYKRLTEIPVQFGVVKGDFDINNNKLTSLKGCPNRVENSFFCNRNELTSLEGGPMYVDNYYKCSANKLTTLKGSPEYVGGDFACGSNRLTSTQYAPKHIGRHFQSYDNNYPDELTSFRDPKILVMLLKHQEEYGLWNTNGSLNKGRWDLFMKDYEAGILN